MTVFIVERDVIGADHWVEKVFSSRLKADVYCIQSGCKKRLSENADTDWENPENGEIMYITEMKVEE